MVAAAPWACVAFALSLPGALLLNQAGAPRQTWFLLAAMVNLLALARMALAWQRQLAGAPRQAPSLDGAHARVLGLVFGAIVCIAALKAVSYTHLERLALRRAAGAGDGAADHQRVQERFQHQAAAQRLEHHADVEARAAQAAVFLGEQHADGAQFGVCLLYTSRCV